MRGCLAVWCRDPTQFPIPMRGNEMLMLFVFLFTGWVPDPHEG